MGKKRNLHDGAWGEQVAVDYLIRKGYLVLHRNWRYQKSEVDVICVHQNRLVFVEVKYRSTDYFGDPEMAVSNEKIKMLQIAAEGFMEENPNFDEVQFDIVSISGPKSDAKLEHFEDAFFPSGN